MLSLGQQLQKLPQIKEALAQGRLGWTKASRIARIATTEDEATWLDSALSLSVRELDRKINEQRDAMEVKIRAWLTLESSSRCDTTACRMAAQKAMGKTDDSAIRYLLSGPVLLRNLTIALIVGVVLSAVNQGGVLLNGDLSARVWIKVLFNLLVPFTVASVSCVVNRSGR